MSPLRGHRDLGFYSKIHFKFLSCYRECRQLVISSRVSLRVDLLVSPWLNIVERLNITKSSSLRTKLNLNKLISALTQKKKKKTRMFPLFNLFWPENKCGALVRATAFPNVFQVLCANS